MSVHALQGNRLDDYLYLRDQVLNIRGVKDAVPTLEGKGLTYRGAASGVMVRGDALGGFTNRPLLKGSIIAGDLQDFTGNTLAVGTKLADKLGLRSGDFITLTAPQARSTPFGSIPAQRSYKVALIFDVGMFEYNSGFVFMPLDTAQSLLQHARRG